PKSIRVSKLLHSMHNALVVSQRLAHAHEHDVAQTAAFSLHGLRRVAELLDDLCGRKVAVQAALTRCAERTCHAAASLGRDTQRCATTVTHEYGFQQGAIVQTPQGLGGLSGVCGTAAELGPRRWAVFLLAVLARGLWDIGHLFHIHGVVDVVVLSRLLSTEFWQTQLS